MINYYTSPEHQDFCAARGTAIDQNEAAFFYVIGAFPALRRGFQQIYDERKKEIIPDGLGGLSGGEYAGLEIAFEMFNPFQACNFIDNYLRLDPENRRVIIEALGIVGGGIKPW